VVLYAPSGKLLFTGGITVSRGHQGNNPGREALISCLTTNNSNDTLWPVFGCPLWNSEGTRP
jgi:hypothetical protein